MAPHTRPCCAKIAKLPEVTMRRKRAEIYDTYKRSICFDARKKIFTAKCQECGLSIAYPNLAAKYLRPQSYVTLNWQDMSGYLMIFGVLLLIGLAVYIVHQYNHTFIYGTGGCMTSLIWTHHDCPVLV